MVKQGSMRVGVRQIFGANPPAATAGRGAARIPPVMAKPAPSVMDKIVSLCKRRGFVFPASEIYGGQGSTYDWGPLGVELRQQ